MRDVFYHWFDDERAPRPVSKTPPARLAARRKLLNSLLVEIARADDPLAGPTPPQGCQVEKGSSHPESAAPAHTNVSSRHPRDARSAS